MNGSNCSGSRRLGRERREPHGTAHPSIACACQTQHLAMCPRFTNSSCKPPTAKTWPTAQAEQLEPQQHMDAPPTLQGTPLCTLVSICSSSTAEPGGSMRPTTRVRDDRAFYSWTAVCCVFPLSGCGAPTTFVTGLSMPSVVPMSNIVGVMFLFSFVLFRVTLSTKPTNLSNVTKSTEMRQGVVRSDRRDPTPKNRLFRTAENLPGFKT